MMSNDERANAMCVIQRFTFIKILALYIYIYIYTAIHVTERGRRNRKENSRPRDEKNRKVVTGIRVRKLSVSPGKRCFPLLNTKKGARHSLGEFANGYVRK